jgi:hypothetical protein
MTTSRRTDHERDQIDDADPRVSRVESCDHGRDAEHAREDERKDEDSTAAAPALGFVERRADRNDALEDALPDRLVRHPRNVPPSQVLSGPAPPQVRFVPCPTTTFA